MGPDAGQALAVGRPSDAKGRRAQGVVAEPMQAVPDALIGLMAAHHSVTG
jgi:hypothetical protein